MTRRFTAPELARWRVAQSERVRNLRKRFGLTQAAMAALCGVDRRTLVRWEGGASTPTASALVVIQALQVHGRQDAVRDWAQAGGLAAIVAHATGRPKRGKHEQQDEEGTSRTIPQVRRSAPGRVDG